MPTKSATKAAAAAAEALLAPGNERLYVRNPGPGTLAYPSPRPKEDVPDLILPPNRWVEVHPVYEQHGIFRRDLKTGKFEGARATEPPVERDLAIAQKWDNLLKPDQRQFVYHLCSVEAKELNPQQKAMITIGQLVNDNGQPRTDNTRVTVAYLRETHRPFLHALLDLEKRWQARRSVIELVQKELARIDRLPN